MDAEQLRCEALHSYGVLDTPPDQTLDKVTRLAAELFEAPMAAISLIEGERQWFKSRVGDLPAETPRSHAFCDHTIRCAPGEIMLVEDASSDQRFRDNPLVTAPDGIRFYLGAPLIDRDGHALGALCVIDSQPRSGLTPRDHRRLQVLAQLVVDELDLRRAARRVEDAQRLLSMAESMAGVGHWRLRRRDGQVQWSDEVYRIHGVERAHFDPSLDDALHFYVDDGARVKEAVEVAFATRSGFSYRSVVRRPDGALRQVDCRAVCELDEGGEPIGLFGVFQDITEQAELVEAANAAARAKSDFLANMSHELRTPLNSIIGFTHVLVRDETLKPEHRHHLTRIEEAGRTLLAVVNDVLDFSRIEAEGVKLSPRPFSPVRLMENLIALVHPNASDKGLALVGDYPASSHVLALGDVDRLRQVLMNLLTNAIKFTHHGQVRLALETRARHGRVQLVFQVSDTGIGISAEQVDTLFRRFSQADASIARRFGGTGLGLAISKRLIEAMDGSIEVWSEVGYGSTFEVRVELPVAESLPAPEAAPPAPRAGGEGGPLRAVKVLVAEDVPVNQELVRLMLAPLGCEVTVVADGEQAVDAVGVQDFDVILMDMQMPRLDGLEATRMIRRLGGTAARTPIVALTANVLPEQVERCRRAGMNDHVAKPFVTESLQSAVLKWADVRAAAATAVSANPVLDDLIAQIGAGPVKGLLSSLDALMVQVVETPADGDPAALSRLAHSLRGAAGTLGYGEVTRACQDVETIQRAGEPVESFFAELQRACRVAREALEARLAA